jgi:hypothetical protein
MSTGALDPLIHDPERLRIVATPAALPDGDALSATRLQHMTGRPGSARPDGAVGPGRLFPREAGKTRAQGQPSSLPRSMAAPSRLGPRRAIMSQDGLDRSPGRVSRRGAKHPVRHRLDAPPERCR